MASKKAPEQQEPQEHQEQQRDEILANEDKLIRGLLKAAKGRKSQTRQIEIVRDGEVAFSFRIRPLLESEVEKCYRQAAKYVTNQFGVRIEHDFDRPTYHSWLIYTATVDEDREKLWDNKAVWQELGVLSGPDVINEVLFAGEKQAIVREIERLSGTQAQPQMEELAKN